MDQLTKTNPIAVPSSENSEDAHAAATRGRDSGNSVPGQNRGEFQKTVLTSDIDYAATVGNESRASAIDGIAPPKLNLSSSILTALCQRYDILSEAGHGNMGNVYKARDRETGETVALKLIKPEIASDQMMIERFKNELLFARKITHKNVCRVYEFNRIGGIDYTSMEFVEGESLRSVLSRFGGLPVRKAVDLALQICSGLKEAHAQGIVHRDLKPENVMIDAQGNVKIMDFGIARSMEAGTRLTGAMIGTPAYMAPEQVSGKPVDFRTDIYALGLVLYEMFTGSETFHADTPVAIALKQMQEAPAPPHDIDPNIPVYIELAILKCLEKDPAKRFQSAAELESALRSTRVTGAAIAAAPLAMAGASMPAHLVTIPRKPVRKSKSWAAIGVIAVVLFALGVLWAMNSATQAALIPPPPLSQAPDPPPQAYVELPKPASAQPTKSAPPTRIAATPRAASIRSSTTKTAPSVFPRLEWGENQPDQNPKRMIWVGRFGGGDQAQEVANRIENQNLPVMVVPRRSAEGQKFFVVLSGPYKAQAGQKLLNWLHTAGFHGAHAIRPSQAKNTQGQNFGPNQR